MFPIICGLVSIFCTYSGSNYSTISVNFYRKGGNYIVLLLFLVAKHFVRFHEKIINLLEISNCHYVFSYVHTFCC